MIRVKIISLLLGALLALITFSILLFFTRTKTRDYPKIQKDGILNMVTENNLSDYYTDEDTIAGFQYELSQYISSTSGLKVVIFLENDLDKCILGLENNTYDIIARNIPITKENKDFLAFTHPISRSKQVLIQRKEEGSDKGSIVSHLQLAHKTLHVPKRSSAILRIKNLSEEIAEPIYIQEMEGYSKEQLISMVADKSIDYAVMDKKIAQAYQDLYPNIDINMEITFTQLQAWAVRKNAPILRDSLNKWLSEKMAN